MDIKVSVSDEIIKVLDYLFDKFGIAVDWTSDEVIPYLQTLGEHIVAYKLANSIFISAILIIVGFIGIYFFVRMVKLYKNDDSEFEEIDCIIGWIGGIVGAILLITACFTVNTTIKCLTLPEVIIIDYIKEFGDTISTSV